MSICYLICPCSCGEYQLSLSEDDMVIAVDGGYRLLSAYGLKADVTIGDFDSLGYLPSDCPVLSHPVRKDDTDTFLAIKYAYGKGERTFVILGGSGGDRSDHTLANLSVLVWLAERGARGYLVGEGHAYTVIKNSCITLNEQESGDVSVFSFTPECEGVTIEGLSYTLENARLSYDIPLGVSNSFAGGKGSISVQKGVLGVYWQSDLSKILETVKDNEKRY